MADFIAVIRRAVDGLTEDTPEMRAKVYERARAAVVRQLENMKPRPPELMFQRQLDKLDAAIREVESEHAEAMPADASAPVAPVEPETPAAPEPVAAPDIVEAQDAVAEPAEAVHAEPALDPQQPEEPESEPETVAEPVAEAYVADTAPLVEDEDQTSAIGPNQAPRSAEPVFFEEDPVYADQATPAAVDEMPEAHAREPLPDRFEPVADRVHAGQDDLQVSDDTGIEQRPGENVVETAPSFYEPQRETGTDEQPDEQPRVEPAILGMQPALYGSEPSDLVTDAAEPADEWPVEVDRDPDVVPVETPVMDEVQPPMPKVSYDENDVVAGFNDFVKEEMNRQVVPPPPQKRQEKQDDFSWDAPFDDLPDIPKPVSFEKALEAKQKEIAEGGKNRKQARQAEGARSELEDLLGIDPNHRRETSAPANDEASLAPPDFVRATSKLEGKSFKLGKKDKKKRRGRKMLPLAIGLVGVLSLAGAAYGLWLYRDDVSRVVSDLMPADDTAVAPEATTQDTAADPSQTTVKAEPADTVAEPKQTEIAALDTDAGPPKFTQRLLADGTETETDVASLSVDQALPEGKTVAGQTEKSKEVAEANPAEVTSDATQTSKPADNAQPLAASQKMFLYEERLGQSSPVAVAGSVVWTEKNETENGKPNPSIEAQVDIPQRKIKALISIKRNTDVSLPASHIIEIVFALPKDFQEGNIENVQRVAFKRSEEDRGDPLIAVPAKITDDFHMIALNDDAEARKSNTELMKTRSWIDIPVTYRNGRRALITLEKGASGTAIFDKVMSAWDRLGSQASTTP